MNLLTSRLKFSFLPFSCVASQFLSGKTVSLAEGVDERVNKVAGNHLETNQVTATSLNLSQYTGYTPPTCGYGLPKRACDFFLFFKNSEEKKRELELVQAKEYLVEHQYLIERYESLGERDYVEDKQKLSRILEELIKADFVDNKILDMILRGSDYKEFLLPAVESMLKNHVVNPKTVEIVSLHMSRNYTKKDVLVRMQLTILTQLNDSGLHEEELLDLIRYHISLFGLNPDLKYNLTIDLKNITRDIIQRVLIKNIANDSILSRLFSSGMQEYMRKEDLQNIISNMTQRNVVTVKTLSLACDGGLPRQVNCDIVDNILKNKALIQEHFKILEIVPYGLPDHYVSRIIDSVIINKTVDNNTLKTAIKHALPQDVIERIVKSLIQSGKMDENTLKIGSSTPYNIAPSIITSLLIGEKKLTDYSLREAINYKMKTDVLISIIDRMIKDGKITSDTFEIAIKNNLPAELIKRLLNQLIENEVLNWHQAKSLNILDNALKSNVISSEKISHIVDEIIKWEFGENIALKYLLYYGRHDEIDRVVKKMQENDRMDPLSHMIHQSSKIIRSK